MGCMVNLRNVFATTCFVTVLLVVSAGYGADYKSGVTARVLGKSMVTGNGSRIVYPGTDKAEVTLVDVELAPGAETGWHKHPVPVYAYVVSGSIAVELENGMKRTYAAGDVIFEVVDTLHNGKNTGTVPVKMTVVYLGAEGTPNVVKAAPGKQ